MNEPSTDEALRRLVILLTTYLLADLDARRTGDGWLGRETEDDIKEMTTLLAQLRDTLPRD